MDEIGIFGGATMLLLYCWGLFELHLLYRKLLHRIDAWLQTMKKGDH